MEDILTRNPELSSNCENSNSAASKALFLTFNEKLKSEDAEPYAAEGFLVIADGMGYSGLTKHKISTDIDTIFNDLFKDIKKDDPFLSEMKELTEFQFSDFANSDEDKTSAYWGSRLLVLRAIYSYKQEHGKVSSFGDKQSVAKWRDYLFTGLNEMQKLYGLSSDEKAKKYVFASTFASIYYEPTSFDKLLVRAVWAGDSRCYYLNKDGLKQLSIDDEDDTGSLSNMFCVSDHINTVLNTREYHLDIPCVLFTASDGIFDCFSENLGLEKTILEMLNQAKTMGDLRECLQEFFKSHKQDDASIAFATVGYKDFDSLQEDFKSRLEFVLRLFQNKQKFQYMEVLKKNPNALKDCNGYMEKRILAAHIKEKFFSALVNCEIEGRKDPWLSEKLKSLINERISLLKKEFDKAIFAEQNEAGKRLINYLSKNSGKYSDIWADTIFNRNNKIKKLIDTIASKEKEIKTQSEYLNNCLKSVASCQKSIDDNCDAVYRKIVTAKDALARINLPINPPADKNTKKEILKSVKRENEIIRECLYVFEILSGEQTDTEREEYKKVSNRPKDLNAKLKDLKRKANDAHKASDKLHEQKRTQESKLAKALEFLSDNREKCLTLIEIVLKSDKENSDFQNLKTALSPREFSINNDYIAKIVKWLIEHNDLADIVREMVSKRWESPDASNLDLSFGTKNFSDYREYNNAKILASNEEFEAYLVAYKAYLEAYSSLIAENSTEGGAK